MIYILMMLSALLGCAANKEVKQSNNNDSSTEVEEDKWSFATWEECDSWQGSHPCNFSLIDQNGDTVSLYDHYGKVILIDLSAMWCGYCINIAPKATEWKLMYGEDKFIWLTLLVQDFDGNPPDVNDLKQWSMMTNTNEPILAAGDMVDSSGEQGYPVTGYPTIVLVNKEMVIFRAISGWNEDIIKTWIEEEL
tara:strand:+ start:86 stop:664 length:579 start_codon:yes stop_codon:yes gene_type:complete